MKLKNALFEAYALRPDEKNAVYAEVMERLHAPETAAKHSCRKSAVIITALVLMLTVGVSAVVGAFYFAPGVGILDDFGASIYSTEAPFTIGNITVDTVTRTQTADKNTVSVWVFRAEEVDITPEQQTMGIAPDELVNFTLIYADGSEYRSVAGRMASVGFSQYVFDGVPAENKFSLRDHFGNTVAITLNSASVSKNYGTGKAVFGDKTLVAVPVSGSKNLFAAQLNDPFTLALSDSGTFRKPMLYGSFKVKCADGSVGAAYGELSLDGCTDDGFVNYSAVQVGVTDYGREITEVSPAYLTVRYLQTNITANDPSLPVMLTPEVGGSVGGRTLFDTEVLKIELLSVENIGGKLSATVEISGLKANKNMTGSVALCNLKEVSKPIDGSDEIYTGYDYLGFASFELKNGVQSAMFEYNGGNGAINQNDAAGGEKLLIQLDMIFYTYSKNGTAEGRIDKDTATLGRIKFK